MAKEKFVPVNGAYNITSAQKDEFTQFLRNKIKQNNKFTPSGKPSKDGVITKTYIDGKLQQFRNRSRAGVKSVDGFNFAAEATKDVEKAKRAKGIKDSSAHLTKAQKDASKAKASAIRKTGKEADHIIEIQESIGYLEQLELEKKSGAITTRQYNKQLKDLRARGIGDDPKNIQALTAVENSRKQAEVAAKNKALRAMELKNPSARAVKLAKNGKALKLGKFAGKVIPYVGGAIALSSFGGSVHAMQKEGLTKKTGTDLAFRTADLALEGVDALTGGLSTPVTLALQLALAGAEHTINQGAAKISTRDRKKFR